MFVVPNREVFLPVAGVMAAAACVVSFSLIARHQQYMSNISVQSKTVGIIWMIPIYSIDSYLSLWMPSIAIYVNMLRDCYEAYVLYLFLSLMLSYLGCEDESGEYELACYLEKQPPAQAPCPFNYLCPGDLPRGRAFLRYCKFGTLQYCVVRPLTTLLAILLGLAGLYDDNSYAWDSVHLYLLLAINVSVGYAFVVLASFYYATKKRLKPYAPVGKFLSLKFVIFFAFWQSVGIGLLVHVGWVTGVGRYDAHTVSVSMQDFLICLEMLLASVAFTYTFPYRPFTPEGAAEMAYALEQQEQVYMEQYEEGGEGEEGGTNATVRLLASMDGMGGRDDDDDDPLNTYTHKPHPQSHRVLPSPIANTGAHSLLPHPHSISAPSTTAVSPPGEGEIYHNTHDTHTHTHNSHRQSRAGRISEMLQSMGAKKRANSSNLIEISQPRSLGSSSSTPTAPHKHAATASAQQCALVAQSHAESGNSGGSGGNGGSNGGSGGSGGSSKLEQFQRNYAYEAGLRAQHQAQGKRGLLDKHFAASSAIRDFNEIMPVVVLPSAFHMQSGRVVQSDPSSRLRELQEQEEAEEEEEEVEL
jgi:uncharacterized membrane protein YgcG